MHFPLPVCRTKLETSRYRFPEETLGPCQVTLTAVGVQQMWKEWICPFDTTDTTDTTVNVWCLLFPSKQTRTSVAPTYAKSHIYNYIGDDKKGKLSLFSHCRHAQLSLLLCPAGDEVPTLKSCGISSGVYVLRVCVQPSSPTTGCRGNIL